MILKVDCPMTPTVLALLLATLLAAAPCCLGQKNFTDDMGVTHTFVGRPTFVTFAQTAVGLSHFGLKTDQLLGTYGERIVASSDYDFENPERGSTFVSDPTPEELSWLNSVPNLSPGCKADYCNEMNMDLLRELNPDYMVMLGDRQSIWAFEDNKTEIESIVGKPVIFIDISQDGPRCSGEDVARCSGVSLIDVIYRYDELSDAMGIERAPTVTEDRKRLCQAAANFQEVTEQAHDRGVRVMAAYLGDHTTPASENGNYFASPTDDLVLRMLEELGMPIMHTDCEVGELDETEEEDCPVGYFWENIYTPQWFGCDAEWGPELVACNAETLYPMDFLLYDQRSTATVTDPAFAERFPDRAVIAGQMAYWPIGAAGGISYRHAAEILEVIGEPLSKAQRVKPATDCTPGTDVSGIAHRVVGLKGGEYACFEKSYHNGEYLLCEAPKDGTDDNDLSTGAIAGIAIGGGAFVASIFVVFLMVRKKMEAEKEADTGAGAELEATEEQDSKQGSMQGTGSLPESTDI